MRFSTHGSSRWALMRAGLVACALAAAIEGRAPAQDAGSRWALLIGVDDYAQIEDLKYSGNDQRALAEVLAANGFPQDQVFLLHDGAEEAKYKPFRENIERQLDLVLQLPKKGDLMIVAFSGHGVHLDGKSYLCPSGARLEEPDETMIPLDTVYERLQKCPANLKLFLVDACRNDPRPGGARSLKPTHSTTELARTLEKPPEGILVLSSCAPGQISIEDEQLEHGVFMKFLLDGLRGKAADEEGVVRLTRLVDYTQVETKKYVARRWNEYQSPSLEGNVDGPFELARLDPSRALPDDLPAVDDLLVAPFDAGKARAAQEAWAKKLGGQVVTQNSIGMKLVLIPPGEFQMGGEEGAISLLRRFPEATPEDVADEFPKHPVRITRPYYLSAHEVTLGQFLTFYHAAKYKLDSERDGKGGWGWTGPGWAQRRSFVPWSWGFKNQTQDHPVVNVTWNDAIAFCRWLSQKEGRQYRLPTEAEWEYTCRAGSTGRYWFGNDPEDLVQFANTADQSRRALWSNSDALVVVRFEDGKLTPTSIPFPFQQGRDGYGFTSPVGVFRPNPFGLYDMHGNVGEWCDDRYQESYYDELAKSGLAVDPQGPATGSSRVFRGGGNGQAIHCRSASRRDKNLLVDRYCALGFRVAADQIR